MLGRPPLDCNYWVVFVTSPLGRAGPLAAECTPSIHLLRVRRTTLFLSFLLIPLPPPSLSSRFLLSSPLSLFPPSPTSLLPSHLPHSLPPRLSGAYIASPCNCDIILEEYNRIVCSGSQCHTSRSAQHYTPVITSCPPPPLQGHHLPGN